MELNLDDEYYQKYMKYKQRYHMLKQLKNNNELEGGIWPFDGWDNSKKKEEEAAAQAAAAAAQEAEDKVETYLVFHYTDETDPTKKNKIINQFRRVESRTSAIKANKDKNVDLFFSLKEFHTHFKDAYIITVTKKKDGTSSTIKYIDADSQGMTIDYKTFLNYMINQQNKLLKEINEEEGEEEYAKDSKRQYINTYSIDNIFDTDLINAKLLNGIIETRNDEILQSIDSQMKLLISDFEGKPEIIKLKKYSEDNLRFDFGQVLESATNPVNGEPIILNKFFERFSSYNLEKGTPNVILHVSIVKDDAKDASGKDITIENIYIEEFKGVTNNDTYFSIKNSILEYDKSSNKTSTSQEPPPA